MGRERRTEAPGIAPGRGSPTPSCAGSGAASASTGPGSPARPPGAARPSTPRSEPWSARMAAANPLWGAPRIHGELLKLGIDVAERTVSRLIPKRRPPPSQTWRTFLTNHVRDLVSIDFFTVPTARLARPLRPRRARPPSPARRPLQRHRAPHRRTGPPSRSWTPSRTTPRRPTSSAIATSVYGQQFRHRVKGMGIDEVLTAPHSPWQNPFAERLIGSIRRECLDHVARPRRAAPAPHPDRATSRTITGHARISRSTRTRPT